MWMEKPVGAYLIPALWMTPLAIISFYFAILDPDWHHDGILFKPAVDVASGLSLFRDTFTLYGALTTYIQAGAIYLFGKYLIVLRLQAALFLVLIGFFNILILERLCPRWLAITSTYIWFFLAPIFILTFLPWSSIYALLFCTIGVWCLVLSVEKQHVTRPQFQLCFFAGIAMACGFWSRQPVGIVFATTLLFFVAEIFDTTITKRIATFRALTYVAGFVTVSTGILGWLYYDDALHDWWLQSIVAAHKFAEMVPNGLSLGNIIYNLFPSPNRVYLGNNSHIWQRLPVITLAITCYAVISIFASKQRQRQNKSKILLILCLSAIGSWHQYFPVPDIGHMFWAATPMIGLAIVFGYLLLSDLRLPSIAVSTLVILISIAFFGRDIHYRIDEGMSRIPVGGLHLASLKGMQVTSAHISAQRYHSTPESYRAEFKELNEVLTRLRQLDSGLALISFTPDVYLTSELALNNPHKIYPWWPWLFRLYPERKGQVINFIRDNRPIIEVATVAWGGQDWSDPTNPARERFGFSDYQVLITLGYADWGSTQLLIPPELLVRYDARFSNESVQ
jgi:hypothetical protein